ncbi:MAG: hypothetical protein ACJATI_003225 [Halioglobus sp.]|jgi:hypothetical protein
MKLTKSDFLKYKECSSYAWFNKNKPEILVNQEIDPFVQGLIDQGTEVERWALKLFPNGVHVRAFHEKAVDTTWRLITEGKKTIYQATFSDDELYAMIDILQWNDLFQAWDIYEVKSSSSQQDQETGKRKEEYIDDTGFQRILLQKLGLRVANVFLVQLNKEYVKNGEIDVQELFAIDEITDKLIELEAAHKAEINDAYIALQSAKEPKSCTCKYKARNRQCAAFSYLYSDTPEYAVYDLNRIGSSKKQLVEMVDNNILSMDDIHDVSKFKKMKLWQWQTYIDNEEIIIQDKIQEELDGLEYPLYFLDYETLPSAIPKYDGTCPHQQVVFQYSLHIIEHEGSPINHKEYLHTSTEPPMETLAQNLRNDIGDNGSVIVWYKPFEVPRTKELASAVPEHSPFLLALAERIYDLMDIVTKGYYHHKDFKGSASIKAVLPVMCPELSYKTLTIQNGGQAMTTYRDLLFSDKYKGQEKEISKDLLAYCELDTWAMVRIWEEMNDLSSFKN